MKQGIVKTTVKAFAALALTLVIVTGVLVSTPQNTFAQAQASKTASRCLGAAAFPLNNLCVYVHYTVLNSQYVQISSVEECADVLGPDLWAFLFTHLDIYSAGPKVWSHDGSRLNYWWVITPQRQCAWFWPWSVVRRYNVGVWVSAFGEQCDSFIHGCWEGSSDNPRKKSGRLSGLGSAISVRRHNK